MAKKKASREPAVTKKVHVPFEKLDMQEIVSRAADVLGKFAFQSSASKAPVAKSTKWPRLSEACREVISAQMLNTPQECEVVKCSNATLVRVSSEVEVGGDGATWERGVYEECFAFQPYKDANWLVVLYRREETD
jgi:hypothetical protein